MFLPLLPQGSLAFGERGDKSRIIKMVIINFQSFNHFPVWFTLSGLGPALPIHEDANTLVYIFVIDEVFSNAVEFPSRGPPLQSLPIDKGGCLVAVFTASEVRTNKSRLQTLLLQTRTLSPQF